MITSRQEKEKKVMILLLNELENKSSNIQVDEKTREETKEAILEMLIIMIKKIKTEIDNARKEENLQKKLYFLYWRIKLK